MYENDDFMLEMHHSAVAFVNKVAETKDIDFLSVFKQDDVFGLVEVTTELYESKDLLTLVTHLRTLQEMSLNSNELALLMCQAGICLQFNELYFYLSQVTNSQIVMQNKNELSREKIIELSQIKDLVDRAGNSFSTFAL